MKILVINCGSSSLKYQLIDANESKALVKGIVERIGMENAKLTQKVEGKDKYIIEESMINHKIAIEYVINALTDSKNGVISSMDEISGVGHRVVHGGEFYSSSVIIDEDVIKVLEDCVKLAPLHNPPNLVGINACRELLPNTKMVAVFDTAFHQTLPPHAYVYPLPYSLYEEHSIRKYGFHGTSHKYVSQIAADTVGKKIEDLKIVTCHLGNGASIAAIKNGKSVETSMGFTPLAGLCMGTRCGDVDPAIVTYLQNELKMSPEEVNNLMNKESGIFGVSGISSDFRDVEDMAWNKGHERSNLALDIFYYRVKTTIGAYAAAMGGIDVLVYTAGLGENSAEVRDYTTRGLEFLGIKVNLDENNVRGILKDISAKDSKVKVLIVPTDEEMMIAKDTVELIS